MGLAGGQELRLIHTELSMRDGCVKRSEIPENPVLRVTAVLMNPSKGVFGLVTRESVGGLVSL